MSKFKVPALAWIALYTAALVVAGCWLHPVPADWTAENDGYLTAAEALRAGELPVRVFQPLLYPALVALSSSLTGDVFVAARALSAVSAGVVLWLTLELAKSQAHRKLAVLAVPVLALSPVFVEHALLATTDTLFLAFLLAALRSMVRLDRSNGAVAQAAWIGVWVGLAWSTRYVGIALLVPLALTPMSWRQRAVALASAVGAAAPQFVANIVQFGSPTYSEHWRNLAMKLDGNKDWTMLTPRPLEHEGWWEVVASQPIAVLRGAWEQAVFVVTRSFPDVVGSLGFGVVVELLVLVAVVHAVRTRGRLYVAGLAFVGFYLAALCVTFYGVYRLILPVLPVVLVLALDRAGAIGSGRGEGVRRILRAVVLVYVAFLGVTTCRALLEFRGRHTVGLFRAVAWLKDHEPGALVVVGDHPHLGAFTRWTYHVERLASDGYELGATDAIYLDALPNALRAHGADYAIFSASWRGRRPAALAAGAFRAPGIEPVHREPGATVYRVSPR